jgi:Permuted papain-like amidase enzyme, YaeF/YiiX, C92 family
MLRFVMFRDLDVTHKWPFSSVKWGAKNKVGYITKENIVIYPYYLRLRRLPLAKLPRPYDVWTLPASPIESNVEVFFTQNHDNFWMFNMGMHALDPNGAYPNFFDVPIKLPLPDHRSDAEFYERWDTMMRLLQRGDFIFTADSESRVSRLICRWDQGPWSHTATYIGDGIVHEAIPPRVSERPIDVYRNPRYRIGVYRLKGGMTDEEAGRLMGFARRQSGKPYAYRKVLRLALWKLIGGRPGKKQDAFLVSPNDMTYVIPGLELIHIV